MLARWPWLSFWQAVAALGTLAAALAAWFSASASRDAADLKWQRLSRLQKIHEDLKHLGSIPMWPALQETDKFRSRPVKWLKLAHRHPRSHAIAASSSLGVSPPPSSAMWAVAPALKYRRSATCHSSSC